MSVMRLSFYVFMIFFIVPGLYGCSDAASRASKNTAVVKAGDDVLIAHRNEMVRTTNVLANDISINVGDVLSVVDWQIETSKGTVGYENNGIFTYDPKPDIDSGPDRFTYVVADSNGRKTTGTVNVTIAPGWGKPVVLVSNLGLNDFPSNRNTFQIRDAKVNLTAVWTQTLVQTNSTLETSLWAKHYDLAARHWSDPQRLDDPSTSKGFIFPQLIVDQYGQITVVWTQQLYNFIGQYGLYATHMGTDGQWKKDAAGKIEMTTLATGFVPGHLMKMGMDSMGRITLAWTQRSDLYTNRMTADGVWDTTSTLHNKNGVFGESLLQQLLIKPSGGVMMVWSQGGFLLNRSMTADGVWSELVNESPLPVNSNGYSFQSIADSQGRGTLVWIVTEENSNGDVISTSIYANRFTADGLWSAPAILLDKYSGGIQKFPELVLDSKDQATLVWYKYVSGFATLNSNRMTADGVWNPQPSQLILKAILPSMAQSWLAQSTLLMDATNQATTMLLVDQYSGGELYANTITPDGVWNTSSSVLSKAGMWAVDNTKYARYEHPFQPLIDSAGNITMVWMQFSLGFNGLKGLKSLYANRLDRKTGQWSGAIELESGLKEVSDFRMLQSDDKVTVAWQQEDNENSGIQSLYAIQWDPKNMLNIPNSTGWDNSALLESKQTSVSSLNALVSNTQGPPVVIWTQADEFGISYLWSKALNKEGQSPLGEKDAINRVGFDKNYSDHMVHKVEFNSQGILQLWVNSRSGPSRTLWFADFR